MVGVISSYVLQPKGNAVLLGAGVICAVVAVVLDGKAYGSLASAGRVVSKKSIITCVVSGVLMGLWAPFVAHAMTTGNTLGPYSIAVFLTLGALLSCSIWNVYFMKKPLVGDPVNFADYFRGPAMGHVLGLLGGAIWAPAWSSIWWLRVSRVSPFLMRSDSRRPWSQLCGECWGRGRNLKAQAAKRTSICF